MARILTSTLACTCLLTQVNGYAFVPPRSNSLGAVQSMSKTSTRKTSSLQMIDANVIQGAGIAVAGLGVGIGLVAFTENQGERAKERGSGLSESMATSITGGLMEDVEVSTVADVGSLADQLAAALQEKAGTDASEFELSEAEKKRIQEDLEDGW